MVAIQRIIGLILMALGLWGLERDARGQQSITLTAPPPSAVITVTAQAVAPFGASTVCYWVVANFPVGNSGPSQPGCAMNVGTTVNVSWTPVTGATGYDLLTTPTPSLPSGSASIALVTRFMSVTYQDTIPSSPFSYTVNTAPPASATFLLDNLNQSTPAVRLNVTNGLITGTSSFILGAAPIAASGARPTAAGSRDCLSR